jgi:hypothetical protein
VWRKSAVLARFVEIVFQRSQWRPQDRSHNLGMGRLHGTLGWLRPVDRFHPPVFVPALRPTQGSQIGKLPQQA